MKTEGTLRKPITLVFKPTVECLAEMRIHDEGVMGMAEWVKEHRPDCVPLAGFNQPLDLVPHNGLEEGMRIITDNELLVELAGRKCYDSFSEKAKKRSNHDYIKDTQSGPVVHASILYHAKFTFFFAGISRRVSHELIRNYVGADRNEEGSPSQESTRFTHHYGFYVVPPRIAEHQVSLRRYQAHCQDNYDTYCEQIEFEMERWRKEHADKDPVGLDRKRIYEAASQFLIHGCETSFIWTTNPMAAAKFFKERCDVAADQEMQRFANAWKTLCLERWPNLFPRTEP